MRRYHPQLKCFYFKSFEPPAYTRDEMHQVVCAQSLPNKVISDALGFFPRIFFSWNHYTHTIHLYSPDPQTCAQTLFQSFSLLDCFYLSTNKIFSFSIPHFFSTIWTSFLIILDVFLFLFNLAWNRLSSCL